MDMRSNRVRNTVSPFLCLNDSYSSSASRRRCFSFELVPPIESRLKKLNPVNSLNLPRIPEAATSSLFPRHVSDFGLPKSTARMQPPSLPACTCICVSRETRLGDIPNSSRKTLQHSLDEIPRKNSRRAFVGRFQPPAMTARIDLLL